MLPRPPPETNYWAKVFEDSALKTSLEISVTAIEIFSFEMYFNALRVR
jgi:hypothetical protein